MSRKQGVSEQQLLDLAHFETSPAFSALEKLVLGYAVAMTETPVEVHDELFAELREHFSRQALQNTRTAKTLRWQGGKAWSRPRLARPGHCLRQRNGGEEMTIMRRIIAALQTSVEDSSRDPRWHKHCRCNLEENCI